MSDDPNQPQNPISGENPSSIESTQDLRPIDPSHSAQGSEGTQQEPTLPSPEDTAGTAEPGIEPDKAPETQTGQIPVNEPFDSAQDLRPLTQPKSSLARELLIKARNAIQFRKRKKLDRVMTLFLKKKNSSTSSPQVTNDEVEKLIHVSDKTAERYLNILEKENKIKQIGKTGKDVHYVKI